MPCAGAELFEPKLRGRGDSRMAELVPFTVPTESDKTLLVWELSSGPTAEDLHVSWGQGRGRNGTSRSPADWELQPLTRLGALLRCC